MNVLFVSLEFLLPADRGLRVRSLSQLRLLCSIDAVESVTFVSLRDGDVDREKVRALENELPKLRVIEAVFQPIHMRRHPRYVPRLLRLRALRGLPYLVAKCDNPEMRALIARELETGKYDVVYFGALGMTAYVRDARRLAPRARVVLEEHNVEWRIFDSLADAVEGPMRHVWKLEAAALRRYERRMLRQVDAVIAISETDARELRAFSSVNAIVIPPVCEPQAPRAETTTLARLSYLGHLAWQPNVYGLDWLCRDVWRLIQQRVPDVTLTIAGSGLERDEGGGVIVPSAWKLSGITTVGFVESLDQLFRDSIVMVAPIVGGSGVRMKLLEALSAGMPTVTTTDGAAGLDVADGREVLIADDPRAFAEKVALVLGDSALRGRLRAAGYEFLRARHSAPLARERLERALDPI
jgi:glycosyltransferase involved in cell wall biosynthesis